MIKIRVLKIKTKKHDNVYYGFAIIHQFILANSTEYKVTLLTSKRSVIY